MCGHLHTDIIAVIYHKDKNVVSAQRQKCGFCTLTKVWSSDQIQPCGHLSHCTIRQPLFLWKKYIYFHFFVVVIFAIGFFLAWKKNLRIFGWKLIEIFCRTKNQNAKNHDRGGLHNFLYLFFFHPENKSWYLGENLLANYQNVYLPICFWQEGVGALIWCLHIPYNTIQ